MLCYELDFRSAHQTGAPLILSHGIFSLHLGHIYAGTRLPEKGATTGSIIGAIIGVIILLAIIGTAIAMYRKHHNNKLNGE